MKKHTKLVLLVFLISITAGGTVFGYWVDKTQADCNIPLKRNVTVLITGLEAEESGTEEGEEGIGEESLEDKSEIDGIDSEDDTKIDE